MFIGEYVDKLLQQNNGRLTVDEMCLFLISKINEHSKHGKSASCCESVRFLLFPETFLSYAIPDFNV